MSDSVKPSFRIVAKAKNGNGVNVEVAALWPSKIEGAFNAKVSLRDTQIPEDLRIALETLDKYWLNVFPNAPKAATNF